MQNFFINITNNIILEQESSTSESDYSNYVEKLREKYSYFNNWLNNEEPGLYTISGNAGTGKTTYLHYLKNTIKDKNWFILDLSHQTSSICWWDEYWTTFDKFDKSYVKLFSNILYYIRAVFFGFRNEELNRQDVLKRIKSIVKYYSKFLRFNSPNNFFESLRTIIQNNKDKFLDQLLSFIVKFFDDLSALKEMTEKVFEEKLRVLLDILILTLKCHSQNDFPVVIIFDNIERFIFTNQIYNIDVHNIKRCLKSYYQAAIDANRYIIKNTKFIMVIRNVTAGMLGFRMHNADAFGNRLDLTDCFDVDDIINKKAIWYDKLNKKIETIELIKQIAGDQKKLHNGKLVGLKLLIDPLFNYNKRIIIEFLGLIIENKEKYSNQIEKYLEYKADESSIVRFAARSIIRGIILQELNDRDNLFELLKARSKENTLGLGIARKILTVIYNESNQIDNRESIPLRRIIEEIVGRKAEDYFRTHETNFENICELLANMNSYNRNNNDWIQFLDLQFTTQEKADYNINSIDGMKNALMNNLDQLLVDIMPAGFAYIMFIAPSFEFFSVRYIKNYSPLFMSLPNERVMKQTNLDVKSLLCYKIIYEVQKKAEDCIAKIRNDTITFKFNNNQIKNHKNRIINLHKEYIDRFIEFINIKYLNKGNEIDKNRQQLISEINKIKNKYV